MRVLIKDNIKEIAASWYKKEGDVRRETVIQMYNAMTILEAQMKQNIRVKSGLNVRTGTLLNSVQKHVSYTAGLVKGTVGPENVIYAATHEFGSKHWIQPKKEGGVLSWMQNGERRFSKGHFVNIPARPFIQPAIDDQADYIREQFGFFIKRAMERN